ncbi:MULTISPECIES: hypothetical protein [Nocardia]|uniref:hypothetical protein n=1 Tax=Nocardia TaxID=1817 RepID=UPI00189632F9|nr:MULTISPECIES: hypothetical protein [Nocardia]MBF6348915.1 hypothetical protein [Nocardia flavorosea]
MAIQVVTSSIMTSDMTPHIARCVGDAYWVVTWLPGRTLTEPQAMAAMTVAAAVATTGVPPDDDWSQLDSLARGLGLTGREAAYLVAVEQHDYQRGFSTPTSG